MGVVAFLCGHHGGGNGVFGRNGESRRSIEIFNCGLTEKMLLVGLFLDF